METKINTAVEALSGRELLASAYLQNSSEYWTQDLRFLLAEAEHTLATGEVRHALSYLQEVAERSTKVFDEIVTEKDRLRRLSSHESQDKMREHLRETKETIIRQDTKREKTAIITR